MPLPAGKHGTAYTLHAHIDGAMGDVRHSDADRVTDGAQAVRTYSLTATNRIGAIGVETIFKVAVRSPVRPGKRSR